MHKYFEQIKIRNFGEYTHTIDKHIWTKCYDKRFNKMC